MSGYCRMLGPQVWWCRMAATSSARVQLWFFLYSGITPRHWFWFILCLLVFWFPAQLMQSYASCLVSQGVVAASSAAPLVPVLVVQLNAVSACLLFWAFAASFIQLIFTMYAGIACLCCVHWDSISSFPNL